MNSSELKGFLTGLILGDGSIDGGVYKRAFSIKSIQKDFIDMIDYEVSSCSGFKSSTRYHPSYDSHGCHHKENWEYRIEAHPYFNKLYHHFYDDYRNRRISKWAFNWLNDRGLANWYMSDGYVCLVGKSRGLVYDRRVDFCTDRYSLIDISRIQECFKDNYNIDTSVIKRDNFRRLRINKSSYETFFMIISPYIVPSMRYKMYLAYEKQPIWMSNDLWKIQEDFKSANPLYITA